MGCMNDSCGFLSRSIRAPRRQFVFFKSHHLRGYVWPSLHSGIIIDSAGRKVTIIMNAVLFVIGATMLSAANSVPVLLVGR